VAETFDVVVIGAGPTGLACAIEAQREGLKYLVLEKGCLVNSLFHYPASMTFFTDRERLEIGGLPFSSVNVKPTRAEALEYYRRVTDHYQLAIHYEETVVGIQPVGGGFRISTQAGGRRRNVYASRAAVAATGYYDRPNCLEVPGENLGKVSHYALEAHPFHKRKVAVIGGANSAAVTSLDLCRHGADVTLICRERELSRHIKYWIRPDLENRIKENSIRAMFGSQVREISRDRVLVETAEGERLRLENDFVFALIGYHPDIDLLRGAGVEVDAKSYRPQCDPKTLETNVPGLYVAGVVISGRHTNEIFIENGRFHGKHIIANLKKHL
jgi:bacillithiol disulfide reductase